jgi:hypothetical protein
LLCVGSFELTGGSSFREKALPASIRLPLIVVVIPLFLPLSTEKKIRVFFIEGRNI